MELMVTIAIIAILSAVAIPNLISWRTTHQLNNMAREVQAVFQGARVQALKENSRVTIRFDAGAKKIETEQTNRVTGVVTNKSIGFLPGISMATNFAGNEIVYNQRGMVDNNFGGTVTITNLKGSQLRVVVSSIGKPRIERL